jgi:hypothetical protein
MRSNGYLVAMMLAICLAACAASVAQAKDYDSRFLKNFPPGYNGMWYYGDRFVFHDNRDDPTQEKYRWDRFMSRSVNIEYPFYPIPYDWEYGAGRTFNLPDYNTNDWP